MLDDGWFGARDNDAKGPGRLHRQPQKAARRPCRPGGKGTRSGAAVWFVVRAGDGERRFRPVPRPSGLDRPNAGQCSATGRNQYVLDLCRAEVQDYIIANVNATLASAPIDYVKWDMNRHISHNYSPALAEQGRFSHSYILGLYRVLQSIVEQNPDVLFEGCSSGGNRFDLGHPVLYAADLDQRRYRRLRAAAHSGGHQLWLPTQRDGLSCLGFAQPPDGAHQPHREPVYCGGFRCAGL